MANKYVNFISDEHLINCISNLYDSYNTAKNNKNKRDFYSNKIDTIKLTFDAKFNEINEEDLIKSEILRQIDKSINNAIGTFHEEILGGISGYEKGDKSGYDIRALDNSLFADIKNKHNTMNSSSAESLFQKLAKFSNDNKEAKSYWVQILAKGSFNERWSAKLNGVKYDHENVYKISGDQFYKLLSRQNDAFYQLHKVLPTAIADFLSSINIDEQSDNSAFSEIRNQTIASNRTILDEITFENYSYYLGFDKL